MQQPIQYIGFGGGDLANYWPANFTVPAANAIQGIRGGDLTSPFRYFNHGQALNYEVVGASSGVSITLISDSFTLTGGTLSITAESESRIDLIADSFTLSSGTLNITAEAETRIDLVNDTFTLTEGTLSITTGSDTAVSLVPDSFTVSAGTLSITAENETRIDLVADSFTITEGTLGIVSATTLNLLPDSFTLSEGVLSIQAGDAVEEPGDVAHGRGGGGNVGILYKGFKLPDAVEAFQIDDTPDPTPTFASEIERRNAAIRSLAEQIKTVEQEAQQLRKTEDLNNQIRAEELALDTFHVEQFIEQLAIDMHELRQEKRRREEEELITILLNSWNVKIH